MGRKIPGKKHRTVKYPEIQKEKRNALLSKKINAPPTVIDYQEVPKSAQELMALRNSVKEGKFKRKKKKKTRNKDLIDTRKLVEKDVKLPGMKRADKPFPVLVQDQGETQHRFLKRVHVKCQEIIHEVRFENKFNVEVKRNEETGAVESVAKRMKTEVDEIIANSKNIKRKKKKKQNVPLKKWEKFEAKKLAKALDKSEREEGLDFHHFTDEIKFGDIVHGPPELTVPRLKKKEKDLVRRPGTKQLLLNSLLEGNKEGQIHKVSNPPTESRSNIKKKRKGPVDAAKQRYLEAERKRVVDAYRLLKQKKYKNAVT